jgi:3-methyladenine DNA glycosylase/8-oxoguanine DNA glycosylase
VRDHQRLPARAIVVRGRGEPDRAASFAARRGFDLLLTLAPLAHGPGDPTILFSGNSFARATRTPNGPATLVLEHRAERVDARAWGAGAETALARVPELIGSLDDPDRLRAHDPLVHDLGRRYAGVRMTRTRSVFESLLPAIVEQKVVGREAERSYRRLVRAFGEPAPGPFGLMLQPDPARLARLPYHVFHPLGLERRRADTIRDAAAVADRLEEATSMPGPDARRRLRTVSGVGPWSAAEATRVALGDPDAVSVGDYHLPSLVSWALAGEARATDVRMLELLKPYDGQRARVVRLLELGGPRPPAFGPRMALRSIASI